MNKRSIVTIIFLAVLGIGLFNLKRNSDMSTSNATNPDAVFMVGEKAPDFTTISFDGSEIRLSDFIGKPIVLDFWAAWCPFCVEEIPYLESVHQQTKGKVVFLGIHRTDSGESIKRGKEFAEEKGATYTLAQDPTGAIYKMAARGINAMPAAVYIDKEAIVREIKLGPKTEEDIKNSVRKIL